MLGLWCHEVGRCQPIASVQPLDIITLISRKKNPLMSGLINNLPYDQTKCCFCCRDFCYEETNVISDLIIILQCKHVFHLQCFINHSKWKYIDNLKNTNIKTNTDEQDSNIDETETETDTTIDLDDHYQNTHDTTTTTTTTNYTCNSCIICKSACPDFLSVFLTYKKLLESIKNAQSKIDNELQVF